MEAFVAYYKFLSWNYPLETRENGEENLSRISLSLGLDSNKRSLKEIQRKKEKRYEGRKPRHSTSTFVNT
jgi:hypothetical protein